MLCNRKAPDSSTAVGDRQSVLENNTRIQNVAALARVRSDLETAHALRAESGHGVLWHHFVHTPHLQHLKRWAAWHYVTEAPPASPHALMDAIMETAAGDVDRLGIPSAYKDSSGTQE